MPTGAASRWRCVPSASGIAGLATRLAHLHPRLADAEVVVVTVPGAACGDHVAQALTAVS